MNDTAYRRLYSQQTGIAKRILPCVPVGEAATVREITQNCMRATPPVKDLKVVHGCLQSLAKAKLIKPIGSTHYVRPDVSLEAPVEEPKAVKVPEVAPVSETPAKAPVDRSSDYLATIKGKEAEIDKHLESIAKLERDNHRISEALSETKMTNSDLVGTIVRKDAEITSRIQTISTLNVKVREMEERIQELEERLMRTPAPGDDSKAMAKAYLDLTREFSDKVRLLVDHGPSAIAPKPEPKSAAEGILETIAQLVSPKVATNIPAKRPVLSLSKVPTDTMPSSRGNSVPMEPHGVMSLPQNIRVGDLVEYRAWYNAVCRGALSRADYPSLDAFLAHAGYKPTDMAEFMIYMGKPRWTDVGRRSSTTQYPLPIVTECPYT